MCTVVVVNNIQSSGWFDLCFNLTVGCSFVSCWRVAGLDEFEAEQAKFSEWLEVNEEKVKATSVGVEGHSPHEIETQFEVSNRNTI